MGTARTARPCVRRGDRGEVRRPARLRPAARNDRPDLFDANVNGGCTAASRRCGCRTPARPGRSRSARPPRRRPVVPDPVLQGTTRRRGIARRSCPTGTRDGQPGRPTAALDGVAQAGHPIEIEGCDLTDRRMYVRSAPRRCRPGAVPARVVPSPVLGDPAGQPGGCSRVRDPELETGGGAFSIVPG